MAPHDAPSTTAPATQRLASSPLRAPTSPPLQPRTPCTSTCSPPRKSLAGNTTTTSNSITRKRALTASATKKRVHWSTITIHEFGVAVGSSTVPSKGGPPIGLTATPEFTWVTNVGEMAERSNGLHRFSAHERVRLLQTSGESDGMILRYARETTIILASRKRALVDADDDDDEHKQTKKRKSDAMESQRPCAAVAGRARMIPINYV